MTGTFDRQAIQRGFQVYKEVCAACHGLKRVAFRNLQSVGFSDAEVKALAAEYTFTKINDEGEEVDRPGKPADRFPSPYPNEQAARALNNGAWPPDLSLMVKARHDGANYIYSLLTGYSEPPAGFDAGDKAYNPYFEGRKISMAPPLMEGGVEYADGTTASVDQMARDVVYFLQWAAEPEMEDRKKIGIRALIFLLVLSIFFYIAKQRIWRDVH
jgi:ubiquinol-cytochrome c reductase cytochrome c1 subunit